MQPLREEGLLTAIKCSASELEPPIEGAQLIGHPFGVTPTHGRVIQHHSPSKVQAGQMVPNTQHLVEEDYYRPRGGGRGLSQPHTTFQQPPPVVPNI